MNTYPLLSLLSLPGRRESRPEPTGGESETTEELDDERTLTYTRKADYAIGLVNHRICLRTLSSHSHWHPLRSPAHLLSTHQGRLQGNFRGSAPRIRLFDLRPYRLSDSGVFPSVSKSLKIAGIHRPARAQTVTSDTEKLHQGGPPNPTKISTPTRSCSKGCPGRSS